MAPKTPLSLRPWLVVACLWGCLVLATQAGAAKIVGGPCRYDDFPGQATIVAVAPLVAPRPDLPYAGQEVTFTFAPDQPLEGDPLYVPDKRYSLTLTGGHPPGPRFVGQYGLRPGKTLPCRLRLIREGTCTPVLFAFPGIDLGTNPDMPAAGN